MKKHASTNHVALQRELEDCARSLGADLFGVADLAPARDYITQVGGAFLAKFPKAIALVAKTSDTVVEQLLHRNDLLEHRTVFYTYKAHSQMVGQRLAETAAELARILERSGYQALPVFRGDADEEKLLGAFSQKLPAHLAGLGWIGKSCLFVSPELGPRVRLTTVLTDAPLVAGTPMEERCGECRLCVDACPAMAFTGVSFDPAQPREARFDAFRCRDYNYGQLALMGVRGRDAPGHACGLCLYVCPFGRGRDQVG